MHHKKRILIFSLAYFPKFVGGAEVAVKEITDRLGDRYDFDMVTLRLDSRLPLKEKIGNVTIYRVGWAGIVDDIGRLPLRSRFAKIFMPISVWWKARQLHKKNPYHIVWSIMANQAGFAASFFKRSFPSVAFLLTLQEGDPIESIKKKVRPIYSLFEKIFLRADYVQSISNYLQKFAIDMGYVGNKSVVPNGVDISKFGSATPDQIQVLRSELHLSEKDKVVFSASRLVEKNGMRDLIVAMSYLPTEYKLVVVGDGYLKQVLENVIKEYNLRDRVHLCGFINPDQLPAFFGMANVFVRPSLSEGLGNVFLEAMAARVPVIGTSVGGIPDIVHDRETGLMVSVKNPKDIAEKIMLLERDSNLRNKIIGQSYEMVARYDWKSVTKSMDEIFSQIG